MSTTTVGDVRAQVSGVVVAPATDELVDGLGALEELRARVMEALVGFIAAGGHDADGFGSAVSWLRAHVPMTRREALGWVRQAKGLARWPTLAELHFAGELSAAQVDVVCRLVPRSLHDLYCAHDEALSPLLVELCVDDTWTVIDDWVRKGEAVTSPDPHDAIDPTAPVEVATFLRVSRFGDESVARITGELDADLTALFEQALTLAERPDRDGEDRLVSQRQVEALRVIVEFYLAHHEELAGSRARHHPHLNVVMDLAELYRAVLWGLGISDAADLERFLAMRPMSTVEEAFVRDALAHTTGRATSLDGHRLSPAAITTIFGAGSTISRVLLAERQVFDHGRKVRLAAGALRDAMIVRDRGCRFPSSTGERCDAPIAWIDAHHITHWKRGGLTNLDNTLALCARHHGVVHRHGWDCTVDPDGTVHITRPDRTTLTAPPPTRTRPPTLPVNHPTLAGLRPEPPPEPPPVRIDEILAMRDVTDDPRHHALGRRHEPPDHTSGYRVFYVHPAVAHMKLPSDHPDYMAKDLHGNVVYIKSPPPAG